MTATVTDLAFDDGDFVLVEVSPGVFDLATVSDTAAVVQAVRLLLDTQKGVNQYAPSAGWNLMHWINADLPDSDADQICDDLRTMIQGMPFVTGVEVAYLGVIDDEPIFSIMVSTRFGTDTITYSLGSLS